MSVDDKDVDYALSAADFEFICKLVYDTSGIVLGEQKRQMLYRRLMRRIRELKLSSFSDYCDVLRRGDAEELTNFINAVTTNLTRFFRENHHFDYLLNTFLPSHFSQKNYRERLRLWSAGCSTGEEPYSLAMTLSEYFSTNPQRCDAKILATDLDSEVLAKAEAGIYSLQSIEEVQREYKKKYMQRGKGENQNFARITPDLKQLIKFKQLNLLAEPWPVKGPFDVIMCRNVLIYFDKPTQAKIISGYTRLLRPGGLLVLGHSESIAREAENFIPKERTLFEKSGQVVAEPRMVM